MDVLALAQTVPGAIAINAATLIGKRLAGNRGGLMATFGVVLPSFLVITIIAAFFGHFQDEPVVKAAFLGIIQAHHEYGSSVYARLRGENHEPCLPRCTQ